MWSEADLLVVPCPSAAAHLPPFPPFPFLPFSPYPQACLGPFFARTSVLRWNDGCDLCTRELYGSQLAAAPPLAPCQLPLDIWNSAWFVYGSLALATVAALGILVGGGMCGRCSGTVGCVPWSCIFLRLYDSHCEVECAGSFSIVLAPFHGHALTALRVLGLAKVSAQRCVRQNGGGQQGRGCGRPR